MVLMVREQDAKDIYKTPAGVHGVILGRRGELLNDFFLNSFLEKRNLPRRDGTSLPNDRKDLRNEEAYKILKQKLSDMRPELIVIAANCLEARFLEDKLLREIFIEMEAK